MRNRRTSLIFNSGFFEAKRCHGRVNTALVLGAKGRCDRRLPLSFCLLSNNGYLVRIQKVKNCKKDRDERRLLYAVHKWRTKPLSIRQQDYGNHLIFILELRTRHHKLNVYILPKVLNWKYTVHFIFNIFYQISGSKLSYRNELVYAIHDPNNPFIIRRYSWTVAVECDIGRNLTATGHLHHDFSNSTSHHVSGVSNNYTVHMSFYRDSNFMTPIPGNPLHVAVGTPVYVKVFTMTTDWNLKMVVNNCYTKPTPGSPDNTKYLIIRNG